MNTNGNIYLQQKYFVVLEDLMSMGFIMPNHPHFTVGKWEQSKFEQRVMELCDLEQEQDLILNLQGPKSKLRRHCFPVPYSLGYVVGMKTNTNQATFGHLHIGCSGVTICVLGLWRPFLNLLISHSSQTS